MVWNWVIRFEQSHWMKPYIMLNTKIRTAAKKEFEKDSFEFMNNSFARKYYELQKHESSGKPWWN